MPYGRRAKSLEEDLLPAFQALAEKEGLGEVGGIVWYPDRSWHGQTYVPASAYTAEGFQLFGCVGLTPFADVGGDRGKPTKTDSFQKAVHADFTEQTAERNPAWKLDLCEQPIGAWRGPKGLQATMTLVWGRPLVGGGRLATAELGGVTVDQCELMEGRFTLIAPDDYQDDLLEIALWGAAGQELARESLYEG